MCIEKEVDELPFENQKLLFIQSIKSMVKNLNTFTVKIYHKQIHNDGMKPI